MYLVNIRAGNLTLIDSFVTVGNSCAFDRSLAAGAELLSALAACAGF